MRKPFVLLVGFCMLTAIARGEVAPVALRVPQTKAWLGQRVPLYVELRSPGPFEGTASFDLRQLAGVLVIKVGNPVVGSQQLEGDTWFVQTHEFALYSQKSGVIEVPAFSVRFARRESFVGSPKDVQAEAPGAKLDIRRPPGTDELGFLITAESLDVTEAWEPPPAPSAVGTIFKRTIVQRAPNIPGMALAPAPATTRAGIRVYRGDPWTSDKLERGDFLGERRETITYVLQEPGTFDLPALTYVWWNPKTEKLQSKTLPGVRFEVAPPPTAVATATPAISRHLWHWVLPLLVLTGLVVWQRRRLSKWTNQCQKSINSPQRVATRKLLRACRRNEASAAESAWVAWQRMQDSRFQPGSELRSAVLELQRRVFGPPPQPGWNGAALARAFALNLATIPGCVMTESSPPLPELNPQT